MRRKNILTTTLLSLASLALTALVASGQRGVQPHRPTLANLAGHGLIASVREDKRKQVASAGAKKMNVDLKLLFPASDGPTYTVLNDGPTYKIIPPDLIVTPIFNDVIIEGQKMEFAVSVKNIGQGAADACTLRVMYGDSLDALESVDYPVPGIGPGKSAKVVYDYPTKNVHWLLFGVDVDNKLKEADFSNNLYVFEFK